MRTLQDAARSDRLERRTALVARELNRYDIDIAGLCETRFPNDGQLTEVGGGYTFFWKGLSDDQPRIHGVGLAIKTSIVGKLTEIPKGHNARLMSCRMPLTNKQHMSIIVGYAPTLPSPDEAKEAFYSDLNDLLSTIPRNDKLYIVGDFNARVGSEADQWPRVIGRNGVGKMNPNGLLLLQLCTEHQLCITNTLFRMANKYKTSWQHPRSRHWHLIDYVITRQRDQGDTLITRAMRGACCGTDHNLIRSKLRLSLAPRRKTKNTGTRRLATNKLRDPTIAESLATNITAALLTKPEKTSLTTTEDWDSLKNILLEATENTVGHSKRKHQDWFDDNNEPICSLIEEKRKAHTLLLACPTSAERRDNFTRLRNLAQSSIREMKDGWWRRKATEIQAAADRNDPKAFFEAIKLVYGPPHSRTLPLRGIDGTLITSRSGIQERWAVHFKDLLNRDTDVNAEVISQIPQHPTIEQLDLPPSLHEIETAIKKTKNGKSPGPDGLPGEVFKFGGPLLCTHVHAIFCKVWANEVIPAEWKDADIITIYKKGDRTDCGNYRGISLLAAIGKIFARVLLQRLSNQVAEAILPETQCGFRPNRSTTDMVFAARQIQEKCREQNKGLYFAFFDLTKAFDTVNREALWKILARYGCPTKFINLVKLLHEGMQGRVKSDNALSEAFNITNGVKQGCVLAPSLFGIYLTAVIQEALGNNNRGIYIRYRSDGKLFNLSRLRANTKVRRELVKELMFADDCAIAAHTEQDIQDLTDSFDSATSRYGLAISIKKTEVLYQPPPRAEHANPSIHIRGQQLKSVQSFRYLGSTLSSSATIDDEITHRISQANASYGRLRSRVFNDHDIRLETKIRVYESVVLSSLLYGCETWTMYSRHLKTLERFHQRKLRTIMRIRWQDLVPNTEVLTRAQSTSIEAKVAKTQLRWTGHVVRMPDDRLPKKILYCELEQGKRSVGGQRKRFKDTLKATLKKCHIEPNTWEDTAADRAKWRQSTRLGVAILEKERTTTAEEKRTRRHQRREQLQAAPPTDDITLRCEECGRQCRSKIGLLSHSRAHRPQP